MFKSLSVSPLPSPSVAVEVKQSPIERVLLNDKTMAATLLLPYITIEDMLMILVCSTHTHRIIEGAIITFNTTNNIHNCLDKEVKWWMKLARWKQLRFIQDIHITTSNVKDLVVAYNENAKMISEIVTANELMEPVVLDYILKTVNSHVINVDNHHNNIRTSHAFYTQVCNAYKINKGFLDEYSKEMTVHIKGLIDTTKASYEQIRMYHYSNNIKLEMVFGGDYRESLSNNYVGTVSHAGPWGAEILPGSAANRNTGNR